MQKYHKNISTASAFDCIANSYSVRPSPRVSPPSPFVAPLIPSFGLSCHPLSVVDHFPKSTQRQLAQFCILTSPFATLSYPIPIALYSPFPFTIRSLVTLCNTFYHLTRGFWDTHSPRGISNSSSVGININVVDVARCVCYLCVDAQPPWRMCNAVFSMGFFFSASFFCFLSIKSHLKSGKCLCAVDTHKYTENRQTHKQNAHTSSRHTHTLTRTHASSYAFVVVGLVCWTLLVLSLWRILSVSHCVWNLKIY